jgi:phospholipid transport system substrate-binding protein
MTVRRTVVAAAALWLVALLAPPAWAGQPAEQLLGSMDRVLKLVDNPGLKQPAKAQERLQALHRAAERMFDFEEMARRSLALHWEARTAVERKEFVQAFRDLLERAYIAKVELYNGEKIALLGDTTAGNLATVKTKIVTKQGTEVPVDYRMIRRGARWRTWDVVIGDVSLVENYRAQFDKIIQRTSYQQLVQRVRGKQ